MTSSRTCVSDAHAFFCTCGQFTIKGNRMEIDGFYKKAYFAYFKVKLGDQDKPWAPHYVCNTCQWTNRKRKSISFGIPMILRAPSSHHDDCYFLQSQINMVSIRRTVNLDSIHLFHLQYDQHLMTSIFQFLPSKVY